MAIGVERAKIFATNWNVEGLTMRPISIAVLAVLLIVSGWLLRVATAGPSSDQLAGDIKALDEQIYAAQRTAERYNAGSPIRLQADLDLYVLTTTRDMLRQKQMSWLRGIDLRYVIAGFSITPPDEGKLASLEDRLKDAEQKEELSRVQLDRYNRGSLLALTAEMSYLGDRVSAAMAREELAMARLGFSKASNAMPSGRTKDDKDAL